MKFGFDWPRGFSGEDFYAPNFKEVEGEYWFGSVRLSLCASVRVSSAKFTLTLGQEPLELGS